MQPKGILEFQDRFPEGRKDVRGGSGERRCGGRLVTGVALPGIDVKKLINSAKGEVRCGALPAGAPSEEH